MLGVRLGTTTVLATPTGNVPVPVPVLVTSSEYPVNAVPDGGVQLRVRLVAPMGEAVRVVGGSARVGRLISTGVEVPLAVFTAVTANV